MTHNEALLVLRCLVNMTEDETKIEALEMAIESLNEQYYHKKLEENGFNYYPELISDYEKYW